METDEPRDPSWSSVENRLIAEIDDIRATIKHADTKASALLSWVGAVLVLVVAILASGGQGANVGVTVALAGGWVGAGLMTIAVVELMYVVRTQLTGTGWSRYAVVRTADELVEIIRRDVQVDEAQRARLLAARLMTVSGIAKRKARRIRLATHFLVGGFVTLVFVACLFAVAR
ncbi:hypothetical protein OG792_06095 [Micromonospora sp. NBC_01699]|uniref:Pycsar system effector family protein n=1 Tax=Micromonospora sp. NBC_01699 TaxID=2975984 RepID=UPI002E364BEB|nr:Pycsar system effector family protein [Micromonospora sp. NBC_01699]